MWVGRSGRRNEAQDSKASRRAEGKNIIFARGGRVNGVPDAGTRRAEVRKIIVKRRHKR